MMAASILNRKVFTLVEYMCAMSVCCGLVFFAAADWKLTPNFHPFGLLLVWLSICADAVLPNAQERLFNMGSSRLEVTFFTNLFTLVCMTVTTYVSGDLTGIIQHAFRDSQLATFMLVYTFVAYLAITMHMNVVKRFGGVAAVVLATARKGMTLVLSFVLFPKKFSWYYVTGAALVLGGLLVSSLFKIHNKNKDKAQKQSEMGAVRHSDSDGELVDKHDLSEDSDEEDGKAALLGQTRSASRP